MKYVADSLRQNPELAIFLTLALGFLVGRLKVGTFKLGNVVGTLLAGVVVGQIGVKVDPVVKLVFFDLFLFATGYKVGPQFFRGLKKNALTQVSLTLVLCVTSLVTTVAAAKIFKYDCGTAAGLMAGRVHGVDRDRHRRRDDQPAPDLRGREEAPPRPDPRGVRRELSRRHGLRRVVPLGPRAEAPEGEPQGGGEEARGDALGRRPCPRGGHPVRVPRVGRPGVRAAGGRRRQDGRRVREVLRARSSLRQEDQERRREGFLRR